MLPRDLLTAEDVRAAGFRPEEPLETADERSAQVWYRAGRRGGAWDVGLGLYAAGDRAEADRRWREVRAELDRGEAGPEPVDVGDEAVYAGRRLYLRQGGHVLWVAVEGPEPVLARWAAEHLARAVCPRVAPLPPAPAGSPEPPGSPDPSAIPEPPATPGPPAAPEPSAAATGGEGGAEAPAAPEPATSEPDGPAAGASASVAAAATAVLTPRPTAPGRYRRRHLAHARLALVGDVLVVTDARGRDHHLPLDGTLNAPEAIGIVLTPRQGPAYLAVLDGHGRPVVRDGEAGAWAPDDIRAFAAATGLRYLDPAPRPARVDRTRPPVEVEGTPWAFILLTLAAVVALAVLLVVGAPAVTLLAVPVVAAALGYAAARADQTRIP
ncbi:MAG TPA: hypothetical protein VIL48_11345 [Acidimicrobiales bacterium]